MGIITLMLANDSESFANEATFRESRYTNTLLQLMSHNGIIDLSEHEFIEGQITTIVHPEGLFHINGNMTQTFPMEDVSYSEIMGRYIVNEYRCRLGEDDSWVSSRWVRENNYASIVGCEGYWDVENMSDVARAVDDHRWYSLDDITFDEESQHYWKRVNPALRIQQIQGAHNTVGLEKILVPESKVGLGYEVEKMKFITITGDEARHQGDHVGSHLMFRGYEMDGSGCIEAPSNIIPGDLDQLEFVQVIAEEAKCILDSPINRNCGGHINISVKGLDKVTMATRFRHCVPIWYAMMPERFDMPYARDNKLLEFTSSRFWGGKFSVINMTKSNDLIEFRWPSAVKSLDDFMWRHRFVTQCIDITIIREVSDYDLILAELMPLLREKYDVRLTDILAKARLFSQCINIETYDDLPVAGEHYFGGYISQERQRAARQRREEERNAIIRATRIAVEEGLVNPRRRHKVVELGGAFTVQCTIEGVRRSRTVRVTSQGLQFNRGTTLYIDPALVDITIMASGDEVSWDPYVRAGEIIHYNARVESPSRSRMSVATNRWNRPHRTLRSNIFSYYFEDKQRFVAVEEGGIIEAVSYEGRWNTDGWRLHGVPNNAHTYNWAERSWSPTPLNSLVMKPQPINS